MQNTVKHFIRQHQLSCSVQSRYIDLISEAGELGKEILKATDYGKSECRPGADLTEEAGDCLFSLLALMNDLDIDAEQALQTVLQKYERRILRTGKPDSGR